MKIIYYYHIPKCGGTMISHQLKELSITLGGEYHDFNFPMEKFGFSRKLINNYRFRRFLSRLNNKTNDFKFIHHHHGFYGISEIFNRLLQEKRKAVLTGNEFHLFTCIRDPLSFQLSRVNYLRNSCGAPNFSFDDACTNSRHQNIMFKYFSYNHPGRWKKLNLDKQYFMKSLGLMDRVFVLEKLKDLYDWLEQTVGTPVQSPTKKANVGTYSLMPTEGQLEVLKRVNALDQFFYDSVSNSTDKI